MQDVLRVRADDPERLVHRAGHSVTLGFIRESSDKLKRAAMAVKKEYFSYANGWDTRDHWMAYLILLLESEYVMKPNYPEYWEIPADFPGMDPDKQSTWKSQLGRARKEKDAKEGTLLQNSGALSLAPATL